MKILFHFDFCQGKFIEVIIEMISRTFKDFL